MKSKLAFSLAIQAAVLFGSLSALAGGGGNGAPSGGHYSLNIIGVAKGKSADMSCGVGHRIFVPLAGSARINLAEGDFQVLDCNGTDGSAAFQLPSPDPDGDGVTRYSVYVRALGKPGGAARMSACASLYNPDTGLMEDVCSVNVLAVKRDAGKQSFSNVSKTLLYVDYDIDGDGDLDHVPLFDDRLQDYFWSYDNQGLKLLQMRFYEIPTDTR